MLLSGDSDPAPFCFIVARVALRFNEEGLYDIFVADLQTVLGRILKRCSSKQHKQTRVLAAFRCLKK
jgi:hypothetical protein